MSSSEIFWAKSSSKWAQKRGFSGIIKSHCMELIFCMKLQRPRYLNWRKWCFLRKTLFWVFSARKWPKMSPERGFSSFVNNKCVDFYWFFPWSYNSINHNLRATQSRQKYLSKRSLIKYTCSWRDKFILWTLNRLSKII